MPAICARAVNQENPLVIWGSGKQTRDFIYVDDIVEAIISYLPKLRGYETMNLGRGVSNTFRDVAELAATYAGYSPAIKNLEDKPEGVKSRFADIARMKEHYQAKVSLEEGIQKVVEFLNGKQKNSRVEKFKAILTSYKIHHPLRQDFGTDINAACGQLAATYKPKQSPG